MPVKKTLRIFLCFLALIAALSVAVSAAKKKEQTKEEKLISSARSSYTKSLHAAGRSSFHGYCGLMTSCQLRALGINSWRVTNDGNKQFDYYSQLAVTSGGYYITPYYAEDYSLEEALNEISRYGTKDVYNILVGFQWTNTDAGKRWGHAVLINGIIDGTVYFVESYDSSVEKYCLEGTVITCSIGRFAEFYADWTTYEGCIWFGNGDYADGCDEYGTDVTVVSRFPAVLRSQPAVVGQQGSQLLRNVSAGERLRAVGLLENGEGDLYYRVLTEDGYGFIAADAVTAVRVDPEDLSLKDPQIPQVVRNERSAGLKGTVVAMHGSIGAVEAVVTDSEGNAVRSVSVDTTGYRWDIARLNSQLQLHTLEPGVYYLALYAMSNAPVAQRQEVVTLSGRVQLWGQLVQVGGTLRSGKAYPIKQKQVQQDMDRWVMLEDRWYYYKDGKPVTGWVSEYGAKYYLDENGAAVTGNVNVEGKHLYFSQTGALCTGWVVTEQSTTYRDSEGVAVTGWQSLDGALYYFDEDGVMVTGKRMKKDGVTYILGTDGKAVPK